MSILRNMSRRAKILLLLSCLFITTGGCVITVMNPFGILDFAILKHKHIEPSVCPRCNGRYLYVVRPEEDWVDRAFEYLQKAYAQGQSDAVAAYTEGCLTKYASGMEKVHIPAFDADDEDVDSDEDDYPDDDGRFDAYA